MNWQAIREAYPHQWVLVEALDAKTVNGQRIIERMVLISEHGDSWKSVWEAYKRLHNAHREREYIFLHTDREELNIKVRDTFGRIVENE